jgi:hypothetical protein
MKKLQRQIFSILRDDPGKTINSFKFSELRTWVSRELAQQCFSKTESKGKWHVKIFPLGESTPVESY